MKKTTSILVTVALVTAFNIFAYAALDNHLTSTGKEILKVEVMDKKEVLAIADKGITGEIIQSEDTQVEKNDFEKSIIGEIKPAKKIDIVFEFVKIIILELILIKVTKEGYVLTYSPLKAYRLIDGERKGYNKYYYTIRNSKIKIYTGSNFILSKPNRSYEIEIPEKLVNQITFSKNNKKYAIIRINQDKRCKVELTEDLFDAENKVYIIKIDTMCSINVGNSK